MKLCNNFSGIVKFETFEKKQNLSYDMRGKNTNDEKKFSGQI